MCGMTDYLFKKKDKIIEILIVLFLFINSLDIDYYEQLFNKKGFLNNQLIINHLVAKAISHELNAKEKGTANFEIFVKNPDMPMERKFQGPEYFYLLEKIDKRKYIKIIEGELFNYRPLGKKINNVFLICRDYLSISQAESYCLKPFIDREVNRYKKKIKFFQQYNIIGYKLLK